MPVTPTYVALGTITLASTDSEIVFSSIPATYRDLIVVCNLLSNGGNGVVGFQLNGDTASNYSNVFAYGEAPSATGSGADTRAYILGSITSVDTTTPTVLQIQVMDYSATDKQKTSLVRNNYPSQNTSMAAARWANTSAINSIRFYFTGTGLFASGTTISIYGIH